MESNYVRIISALAYARFDSRNELNIQTGALGSTNSPGQRALSPRIKRLGREGEHSRHPFSAQVNNKYHLYTLHTHLLYTHTHTHTPRRHARARFHPTTMRQPCIHTPLVNARSPSQAPPQCRDINTQDVAYKRRCVCSSALTLF